ncbi:MAG: 2-C-methyl-D-erythritol 4-phosphate cytidylyltransferase [Parachlamydiaceae bacterium]
MSTVAILLAGGIGTRMQSVTPKQFLKLIDRPVALHSFDVLESHPLISEIVVVSAPEFWPLFSSKIKPVQFALPGDRRQDSAYSGFSKVKMHSFVCIHDSARPCLTASILQDVIVAAQLTGAACAAVPVKNTIKEGNHDNQVVKTIDRNHLWEIQTPQVLSFDLMKRGFQFILEKNLTVTDDVSLAELLGVTAKLVPSSYRNIKITTPEDLVIAECLMSRS